jgi:succinyl-diaminopimelate desuccinylase
MGPPRECACQGRRGVWGIVCDVNEAHLAEQLIGIDTSVPVGLERAIDFVAGWLDAREVPVREVHVGDRRCLFSRVGDGPHHVLFNGHLDVVPGHPGQFRPERREGRLYGRGAYDMKAALAAMMIATAELARDGLEGAALDLMIVPDEERGEPGDNCAEALVRDGLRPDFVVCGEPTDLQVGIQAKGVVLMCLHVPGTAAHGSTPWLGDNAVLRATELYRRIGELPFMSESSEMFPAPSVNLGRIEGGDALNRVPDVCRMWVDIRCLPDQDRAGIVAQVQALDPAVELELILDKAPARVPSTHPMVQALVAVARTVDPTARAVGRDGSSDAITFLEAGVAAVEFGPVGSGHHGPNEYVEIASLKPYREALVAFVRAVAAGGPRAMVAG